MIDGIYNVKLKTPLGSLKAVVYLNDNGDNTCSGKITCMKSVAPFETGEIDGNNFKFSAIMPTPLGKINFDMVGHIDGDTFYAETDSKLGHIIVSGERAE